MTIKKLLRTSIVIGALPLILSNCGTIPVKQYYVLNYLPSGTRDRVYPQPYPYTIRLKDFEIEEAYNRPQIVYRQSPFELRYYFYRVWAVKPTRMITDLVHKHLISSNITSNVIRRFDEGMRPDYELSGSIEAIEEYDSKELWFAHLAIRMNLTRISDGASVYFRRFDIRKRVFEHEPEYVIREMSSLIEFITNQAIHDIDVKLAKEYGVTPVSNQILPLDTTMTGIDTTRILEVPK